jgi:transposase-like protein
MLACPSCGATERQHKAGTNNSGTQRYECQSCRRTYTPEPKPHGYDAATRKSALKMYVDGINFRRIARFLSVSPQTVCNWVDAFAVYLPVPPPPNERRRRPPVDTLELDELYTFIGEKKSKPTC